VCKRHLNLTTRSRIPYFMSINSQLSCSCWSCSHRTDGLADPIRILCNWEWNMLVHVLKQPPLPVGTEYQFSRPNMHGLIPPGSSCENHRSGSAFARFEKRYLPADSLGPWKPHADTRVPRTNGENSAEPPSTIWINAEQRAEMSIRVDQEGSMMTPVTPQTPVIRGRPPCQPWPEPNGATTERRSNTHAFLCV